MTNIEKPNIAFWNVDTQNDFVNADGALSVEGAEELRGNLMRITKYAKFKGVRVVNTKDDHDEDAAELSDTPDFVDTFPPHCMNGTEGAEFIYETVPENPITFDWRENTEIPNPIPERNIIIFKNKFDAFTGNEQTDNIIKTLDFQTVFVYGVATNFCVDYAVQGLLERGKKVYVFEDAIKELPGLPSPVSDWISKGVEMISFSDIEEYIN